jgi:hypothetical protein
MKAGDTLRAIRARAHQPWAWGILGVLILVDASAILSPTLLQHAAPGLPPEAPSLRLLRALLEDGLAILLLPVFWQWTGDDRPRAPFLRGGVQALGFAILSYTVLLRFDKPGGWPHPLGVALPSILAFIFPGFLIASWESIQARWREAQRQASEARWRLLRAQMSPHVLFNSLNGLAQLLREDPLAAARGMRDLAQVHQRILLLGARHRAPLGEERELLEHYLAVEQLRFEPPIQVEWDWDPALDAQPSLPLVLQPLVENALKHGVRPAPEGARLRISGRQERGGIRLEVANTTPGPSSPGPGVGLANLRARLTLAYASKARLDLHPGAGWFRAELHLPGEPI